MEPTGTEQSFSVPLQSSVQWQQQQPFSLLVPTFCSVRKERQPLIRTPVGQTGKLGRNINNQPEPLSLYRSVRMEQHRPIRILSQHIVLLGSKSNIDSFRFRHIRLLCSEQTATTPVDCRPPQNINRKDQHTVLILIRSIAPLEWNDTNSSGFQPTHRPDPFEPRQVIRPHAGRITLHLKGNNNSSRLSSVVLLWQERPAKQ